MKIKCERGGFCKLDEDNMTCGYCGKIIVPLIKRTFRITKGQDKMVKKLSKKFSSESEVIRYAILELNEAYSH